MKTSLGEGSDMGGSWLPGLLLASLLSAPNSWRLLGPGKVSVHGVERERGLGLPSTSGRGWGWKGVSAWPSEGLGVSLLGLERWVGAGTRDGRD